PQHQSAPSIVRAQVCCSPSATSATLAFRDVTWTGRCCVIPAPFPNAPKRSEPQHHKVSSLLRAQVSLKVAATSTTQLLEDDEDEAFDDDDPCEDDARDDDAVEDEDALEDDDTLEDDDALTVAAPPDPPVFRSTTTFPPQPARETNDART